MTYTLYNLDCLELMRTMDAGSVDCVITDPPYGIGESSDKNVTRDKLAAHKDYGDYHWDKERVGTEYIDQIRRVSKNQVIFGGNYYADMLPPSMGWIVWDKLNGKNDFADCELVWTSYKRAVRKYTYMWNGMIKQKPEVRYHPTQKPLDLMLWIVCNYTASGSTILDPFAGSGTTGVACMMTGRNFIGCEKDAGYYAIAEKRIHDASQQLLLPLEV